MSVSLDLVRRWNLSHAPNIRWEMEGGVFGQLYHKRVLATHVYPDCIVGFSSKELEKFEQEVNGYEKNFYMGGLACGSDLLFRLDKKFWIGIHIGTYEYWNTDLERFDFSFMPGLEFSKTF